MSEFYKATASGLNRQQLVDIGRGATIDTIDGILAQYPYHYDQSEILEGFQKKAYDYGLYFDRNNKRSRDEYKAMQKKKDRRLFWIIGLTSPLWLTASVYGFYLFGDAIKRYPLQVCAVCAVLIAIKVLGGKN